MKTKLPTPASWQHLITLLTPVNKQSVARGRVRGGSGREHRGRGGRGEWLGARENESSLIKHNQRRSGCTFSAE